jgi:hypothetical protein
VGLLDFGVCKPLFDVSFNIKMLVKVLEKYRCYGHQNIANAITSWHAILYTSQSCRTLGRAGDKCQAFVEESFQVPYLVLLDASPTKD